MGASKSFDSDPSTPHVLFDENHASMHVSHQSTLLAQAQVAKRARTGPTPPVQKIVEDKKDEDETET
jgi:hypothetical protein